MSYVNLLFIKDGNATCSIDTKLNFVIIDNLKQLDGQAVLEKYDMFKKTKVITFKKCYLSTEVTQALLNASAICSVNLAQSFFVNTSIADFLKELHQKNLGLNSLIMENYDPDDVFKSTETSISPHLANFLTNSQLFSLELRSIPFPDDDFNIFCDALAQTKTLRRLRMDCMKLSDKSIYRLKNTLLNKSSIEFDLIPVCNFNCSSNSDNDNAHIRDILKEVIGQRPPCKGPTSLPCHISAQILWGFAALLGVAAIAVAFTVFNASALSVSGIGLSVIGTVALLVGIYGLFTSEHHNNELNEHDIKLSVAGELSE